LTLEWGLGDKQPLQARERPFRAGGIVLERRQRTAACREAMIRRLEKTADGELRGEAPGALERSAQYRACRW
jgi:hypothetical protein